MSVFSTLPKEIIDIILEFLSIKKHHGRYSKRINMKEFTNIEKLFQEKKPVIFRMMTYINRSERNRPYSWRTIRIINFDNIDFERIENSS